MTGLDSLLTALELKDETRTGWELRGVEQPESVAAHSWGTALLCLLFGGDADVDVERCMRMALVHDLAEAETGDLPRRPPAEQSWTPEEKEEEERAVMERLAGERDDSMLLELWAEYAEQETDAARFVKDMDLVEMCLQALFYEENARHEQDADAGDGDAPMDEFFATTAPRLTTDTGRGLFEDVRARYEEVTG